MYSGLVADGGLTTGSLSRAVLGLMLKGFAIQ
jgi:hypothetical protein